MRGILRLIRFGVELILGFCKMISVITPCLNIFKEGRKNFFDKMMKSVHTQSYADIEHIFVDGGSKDGTKNLLKEYQKKGWIDVLLSEKDGGIYEAINKGLSLAKGEYVLIMNTDDYFLEKKYLERCVKKLRTGLFDFTHADRIIKSREKKSDAIKKGDERVAFFRMPFRHQTMVVRKSVFDELGSFDEKYKIAADYKFILQMLLAGKKGYHFPEIVLCSLDGGVSSDRKKCEEEVSRVLYGCYGEKYGLSLKECEIIYLRKVNLRLMVKIFFHIPSGKIKKSLLLCFWKSLMRM